MRVLITGVHGFVGSNLVLQLKKNHTIYGLDIITQAKEGVEQIYTWDDLDKGNIPSVDAIIHLAGKAHDVKNSADASVYFKVNTELTKKIYNYYLTSKIERFIFFSSVKAAADFVSGEVLTEEVIPHPVGPYGESKIKAEEYLLGHLPTAEKKVYILRPCMIHGPGNKGNLNLLYGVLRWGIPWPLGSFENRRSFTSIDNLKFVIEGLLTKEIESGIYHMADDEALSTNELVQVICGAMGKKGRIWKLPKCMMNGLASLGTYLHLPLNKERITKLTENYVVSNQKIKQALGIQKMPYTAEQGFIKTIQSFQKQK